ncbi:hypothetical protein Y032_0004g1773 [Ancylostoma ceylanicum]|uniref:Uncharacterized protein n=1 Tax=Ancylostoma ceylanicum TaxID=53326 RepID=A0A016VUR2_9BILA|nr:hypothetical protein Y032_0004g1773 [Ancylostoma ceylanicum]
MPEEDLRLLVLVYTTTINTNENDARALVEPTVRRDSTAATDFENRPRRAVRTRAGVGTTVLQCARRDPAARGRVAHGATLGGVEKICVAGSMTGGNTGM